MQYRIIKEVDSYTNEVEFFIEVKRLFWWFRKDFYVPNRKYPGVRSFKTLHSLNDAKEHINKLNSKKHKYVVK